MLSLQKKSNNLSMPKKFYRSTPIDYAVCQYADCPLAAKCLHQLTYQPLLAEVTILKLLNPNKCSKDETCEFFRDSKPVMYARGFKHFQQQLYPEQYKRFSIRLMGEFGRTGFYERRRGETALSPKEQQIVLSVLQEVGATGEFKFSSYEENYNWYD